MFGTAGQEARVRGERSLQHAALGDVLPAHLELGGEFAAGPDVGEHDFVALAVIADQDGELADIDEQLVIELQEDIVLLQRPGGGAAGGDPDDHEGGVTRQGKLGTGHGIRGSDLDAEETDSLRFGTFDRRVAERRAARPRRRSWLLGGRRGVGSGSLLGGPGCRGADEQEGQRGRDGGRESGFHDDYALRLSRRDLTSKCGDYGGATAVAPGTKSRTMGVECTTTPPVLIA
jgi:hypothetical protein